MGYNIGKNNPMWGKTWSEERRIKFIKHQKGIPKWKNKKHPMLGKHHSKKTKKKMSIAKKGILPWNTGKKRPEMSGEKHPSWKGGRYKTSNGYILIYKPDHPFCIKRNYGILEHRFVIEKQIRRYLLPMEVTHHLGKRDDNRLNMLMLFANHSAHKRFERGGIVKPSEIIFDGRKI